MSADGMVLRRSDPPNAETRLDLQEGLITPSSRFYVRCNFPPPESWPGLEIGGMVRRPSAVVDLSRHSSHRLVATLECAGNGRAFLSPPVPGEQWELGAVSTAEWEGVQLAEVLTEAGVDRDAVEVLFTGADGYQRSLPLETALSPTVLLVTGMNGEPLPQAHGGPVRVLVPGWYGMAALKWLTRIDPVAEPFQGHFQVDRYVVDGRPVREMAVRSVITSAVRGRVHGYAWTGRGVVTGVEVSPDGGSSWNQAQLGASAPPYGWTEWEWGWSPAAPGRHTLRSRASDSTGRVQALDQSWNALGYANNAIQPFEVELDEAAAPRA